MEEAEAEYTDDLSNTILNFPHTVNAGHDREKYASPTLSESTSLGAELSLSERDSDFRTNRIRPQN